jgi:thiazole synthase ThiGH ThiG subunit
MLFAALTALTMAGCAAVNPAGSSVATGSGFDTKLLNLFSVGTQSAAQLNYTPNTQLNQTMQGVTTNTAAMFPIASVVGTGNASATNATAQSIVNNVNQNQNQNQLVL